MPTYNFKTISVVPPAKQFVDIILSRTQRQTPTVIRKGYKITRIRSFYIRKVKFTQQNYHEKITQIIEEFPRLESIHPFYSDLCNVLYSRDHYKLALGQINTARKLIDGIGKDYVRLLKFGDSLYRCKQLKRAALGRMCTIMKKLDASLKYLEQVRQHLSRLPSIDPNTRTLMITGYPNVGKSSFANKISRVNVDVQPYPFTTKSLFVGHTDYNYTRWQVIDTPGILDHPLEERNTIEMQAVTALAHLHSAVLFFIDISEQCGHTIKKQAALFHSLKPLFANKPVLIVATKCDVRKLDAIPPEDRLLLESMSKERDTGIIEMSNITEEGIAKVKTTACDMLLMDRYERKIKGKRLQSVINRIHIAQPTKRDTKPRPTSIPEGVLEEKKVKKATKLAAKAKESGEKQDGEMEVEIPVKPKRRTEKDIELEQGGPGIYNIDLRKNYELDHPDWKYDIIPEFMDGVNISDWLDPDIEDRLRELEKEEDQLLEEYYATKEMETGHEDVEDDEKELAEWIKKKQKILKAESTQRRTGKSGVPRKFKSPDVEEAEGKLQELGLKTEKFRSSSLARSKSKQRKRRRSVAGTSAGEGDGEVKKGMRAKSRSKSRTASRSASVAPSEGYSDIKQKKKAQKLQRKSQKPLNQDARIGEADRRQFNYMPKHLFSGKRGIGKTDRR